MSFNMHHSGQGAPLIVSSRSNTIRAFFNYIGDLPRELAACTEMESKWKIPTGERLVHYGERPEDITLFRRVRLLAKQGYADKAIARVLTAEGFVTARSKTKWSDRAVKLIRENHCSRCDMLDPTDSVADPVPAQTLRST